MNISVIVVTYNRKECLMKCINHLLEQTEQIQKIFVIDNNSSDGTREIMQQNYACNSMLSYHRLSDNTGGSGGFYYGMKLAYESGADFIWGMDDDAYAEENALKCIVKESKKYANQSVCFWSNCRKSIFEGNTREVDNWTFVGFFVPRIIIQDIGLPRMDFFIFFDDCEYAYRIRKKGYKIIEVKNSVINHKETVQNFYMGKKFLGKEMLWIQCPTWKMYYFVRNRILMYGWGDANKYRVLYIQIPKIMIKSITYDRKQFSTVLLAIRDGIFNVTGKKYDPWFGYIKGRQRVNFKESGNVS